MSSWYLIASLCGTSQKMAIKGPTPNDIAHFDAKRQILVIKPFKRVQKETVESWQGICNYGAIALQCHLIYCKPWLKHT